MINIQFVTVPLCKGKETFVFVGGGWGGSEGQKIMSAGLHLPKYFRKQGRCTYLGSVRYNWGIQYLIEEAI